MPKRRPKNSIKNKPYAVWRLFGILLILGLFAIRFNLWSVVTSSNNQTSINSFNSSIANRNSSLEHSFEIYTDTLYSGRALFFTDNSISRNNWMDFVNAQNVIQRNPGVYALAYFKVISSGQKASFVDQLDAERYSNENSFSIYPDSSDSQLAVLAYIAPSSADQSLIGYDIYTDSLRSSTLYAARDLGLPQTTKPLVLKSDATNAPATSILMAMPTYSSSLPINTVSERQAALTGYITLALHTKPLLDSVYKQTYVNNLSVQITTDNKVIYSYGPTYKGNFLKKTVKLNVGGQIWQLSYTAPTTLGLSTTSKITPMLLVLSTVPLILFYLMAFYFSIRYYAIKRHHKERHGNDGDFLGIF